MSSNPTSFRYPPNIEGKADPQVVQTIQDHDDAILDLQQAIPVLKSQITALQKTGTTSTTTTTSNASSATTNGVTPSQASAIATQAIQSTLGLANPQTGTSYTPLQSDYGGIVTLNNASPVAVTLSNNGTGIAEQWWAWFQNNGAGTATLTPSSGTINGVSNITLITGQSAWVTFDGTNWWAATSATGAGSGVTQIVAGTNVNVSPGGGTGVVTVNAAGTSSTTANLTGGVLPPGAGETGNSGITASPTAIILVSLYDATSPAANEFLAPFGYNQNGNVYWSVFNVSSSSVTALSSTVVNIRVFD
jgi:hypothetical protein